MTTPAKRALAFLRQSLIPAGLDVIIPLTLERYNSFLENDTTAASDLRRFLLPPPSPSLDSHLLVLIGNSRALWEPFLRQVKEEIDAEGRVLPNPVDRYVKQLIEATLDECEKHDIVRPAKTYWVADTEPGKMILAQKMAVAAHAVSRCPPSQICLHPVLGPWLAFRCALVFPIEGTSEDEDAILKQEDECNHDKKLHETLAAQMAEALGQLSRDRLTEILPDAWKKWVMPRITIAPSHPMMYDKEQILYHYTKDLKILERVVHAKEHNLCTDYLRDPPPATAVQFRELLQQILREYQVKYPDGIDAISLSGGLDTSTLAEASEQPWETEHGFGMFSLEKSLGARPILSFKHAFTVQADEEAQDALYADEIFKRLEKVSIEYQHIIKVTLEELLEYAEPVAKLLGTCDPMELRNSLVIYATLKRAAESRVKRIVTGDGADEIFCGYAFYTSMPEEKLLVYRNQIIEVMRFTASTLARSFGIEVISPFLDERVVSFAKTLRKSDIVGERTPVPVEGADVAYGKLVMRQAFPEAFSQWRWKQPIEQGAGTTALRMGYFNDKFTNEELRTQQRDAWRTHGVFIRDKEHLFFFRALLRAFDGDLSRVPKRRHSKACAPICPACGFELSHPQQDFCVTCGWWPTRVTATNDSSGYATKALAELDANVRDLSG